MDNKLRRRIDDLAKAVLSTYKIITPIKDMNEVVQTIGGRIIESQELGVFSDGRVKKENDGFAIIIPVNQPNTRKNFTIAHELGHLFLHMGYRIDEELWEASENVSFDRRGNSEAELQANEFAAAFLMPKDKYREVMEKNEENNRVYIDKVADYFNVSIDAALYRGKWLGLLQW